MENKRIYMDYSATTPVKKEVLDEMLPYFNEGFGMHLVFIAMVMKLKKL